MSSCKKSDNPVVDPPAKIYLISIYSNSATNQIITYKYDDKNRVINITNTTPSASSEDKLYYTENDLIARVDTYYPGMQTITSVFTYIPDSVKIDYLPAGSTIPGYSTFTLNGEGKPIKSVQGTGPAYTTFAYDANGNKSALGFYTNGGTLQGSRTYTYNNTKSPVLNIKGNFSVYLVNPDLVNNYITAVIIAGNNAPIITTYTYNYNADGYPVSRTSTTTGSTAITTETFTYVIK